MTVPEAVSNRLIGSLFVERGLVSESQLLVALELQQETGQQLGQILVERFGVERSDLALVVAEHWARMGQDEPQGANPRASESWRQLGEILVSRGFVTREQLVEALDRQRQTGERLGEALVGQGVLSKFELAGSLAEQASLVGDPAEPKGESPVDATVVPLAPRVESSGAIEEPPDESEAPADEPEEPPVEIGLAARELELAPPELGLVPEPQHEAEMELDEPTGPDPDGEALAPEPAVCVAFVSTPRGYRLIELEDETIPEPGEQIDLPDLGELIVLRRGASPLPADDRVCLFLESLGSVPALAVH